LPVGALGLATGAKVFVARAAGSGVGDTASANLVGSAGGVTAAGGDTTGAGDGAVSGLADAGAAAPGTVGAPVGVAEPQPVTNADINATPNTIKPARSEIVRR
jgi:hypothetical protein